MAERNGNLLVGQRILEVNGQSLLGSTHEDAVLTIRQAGDAIVFLVCDGFDPSLVEGLPADGGLIEEENSDKQIPSLPRGSPRVRLGLLWTESGSSVDRDDDESQEIDGSRWNGQGRESPITSHGPILPPREEVLPLDTTSHTPTEITIGAPQTNEHIEYPATSASLRQSSEEYLGDYDDDDEQMSKASATDEDNLHAEPIHNNMSDFDTDNDELGSSNDAPLILDYASPHHETGADNPQTAESTRIAPIIEDTQNANLSDRMQPMDSDRVVMNAEYQQQNLETNLLAPTIPTTNQINSENFLTNHNPSSLDDVILVPIQGETCTDEVGNPLDDVTMEIASLIHEENAPCDVIESNPHHSSTPPVAVPASSPSPPRVPSPSAPLHLRHSPQRDSPPLERKSQSSPSPPVPSDQSHDLALDQSEMRPSLTTTSSMDVPLSFTVKPLASSTPMSSMTSSASAAECHVAQNDVTDGATSGSLDMVTASLSIPDVETVAAERLTNDRPPAPPPKPPKPASVKPSLPPKPSKAPQPEVTSSEPRDVTDEALPSFRDKKKFFEREIHDHLNIKPKEKTEKRFTYLSTDELDKLKQEEERKIQGMTPDSLRTTNVIEDTREQEEMGRLLGMKPLEDDTEPRLQEDCSDTESNHQNGVTYQPGGDLNSNSKHASPCHNLESKVETRQQHIVEIGFDDDLSEPDSQPVMPSPAPRTIAPATASGP